MAADASQVELEIVDEPSARRVAHRGRTSDVVWLTVAVVVLVAAGLLELRGLTKVSFFGWTLPELCVWRSMLGVDCLGCGMTRSIVSLAHGDLAGAWSFHKLGPVVFVAIAVQVPYRAWRLLLLGSR